MKTLIVILILIIITSIFYYFKKKEKFNKNNELIEVNKNKYINYFKKNKKPFLWIYYDNITNSRFWSSFYGRRNDLDIPSYMFLVFNSITKNCQNFNIVILNRNNLDVFIKNDKFDLTPESKIPYILRLNYIKYYILYHYGGLWLDQSIVLKDLSIFIQKLNEYEVIGFGCDKDEYRCNLNKLRPRNNILIARNKTKLIFNCLQDMNYIMANYFNYPSFKFNNGDNQILWHNLDLLNKEDCVNKIFYQFSTEYDGTRDYNNKIITAENLLSLNYTKFLNDDNVYFVVLDYESFYKKFDYQWFLRLNLEQILNSNMWVSYLFRKAMNNKNKFFSQIDNFNINLPPTAKEYLYSIYNNNFYSNPVWYLYFNSSTRNS